MVLASAYEWVFILGGAPGTPEVAGGVDVKAMEGTEWVGAAVSRDTDVIKTGDSWSAGLVTSFGVCAREATWEVRVKGC